MQSLLHRLFHWKSFAITNLSAKTRFMAITHVATYVCKSMYIYVILVGYLKSMKFIVVVDYIIITTKDFIIIRDLAL